MASYTTLLRQSRTSALDGDIYTAIYWAVGFYPLCQLQHLGQCVLYFCTFSFGQLSCVFFFAFLAYSYHIFYKSLCLIRINLNLHSPRYCSCKPDRVQHKLHIDHGWISGLFPGKTKWHYQKTLLYLLKSCRCKYSCLDVRRSPTTQQTTKINANKQQRFQVRIDRFGWIHHVFYASVVLHCRFRSL